MPPSNPLTPEIIKYSLVRYFQKRMKTDGATRTTGVTLGNLLILEAQITFHQQIRMFTDENTVQVRVCLTQSDDKSFWVLSVFSVTDKTDKLLTGEDLLTHLGKTATNEATEARPEYFIVRCSKDLQTLFDEYDHLAADWGILNLS